MIKPNDIGLDPSEVDIDPSEVKAFITKGGKREDCKLYPKKVNEMGTKEKQPNLKEYNLKIGDYYLVELFDIQGNSTGLHCEKCESIDDVWVNNTSTEKTRHIANCNKLYTKEEVEQLCMSAWNKVSGTAHIVAKMESITKAHRYCDERRKQWKQENLK